MVLLALLAIAVSAFLAFSLVVVGLVETPWPVLLGGLLLALYGIQRLSVQSQLMATAAELEEIRQQSAKRPKSSQVASRQISSNSIATQQTPSNQTASGDKAASSNAGELMYRGIRYRQQQPNPSPTQPQGEIIYRGCKVKQPNSDQTNA